MVALDVSAVLGGDGQAVRRWQDARGRWRRPGLAGHGPGIAWDGSGSRGMGWEQPEAFERTGPESRRAEPGAFSVPSRVSPVMMVPPCIQPLQAMQSSRIQYSRAVRCTAWPHHGMPAAPLHRTWPGDVKCVLRSASEGAKARPAAGCALLTPALPCLALRRVGWPLSPPTYASTGGAAGHGLSTGKSDGHIGAGAITSSASLRGTAVNPCALSGGSAHAASWPGTRSVILILGEWRAGPPEKSDAPSTTFRQRPGGIAETYIR